MRARRSRRSAILQRRGKIIMDASFAAPEVVNSRPFTGRTVIERDRTTPKSTKLSALMREATGGRETAYSNLVEEVLPILKRLINGPLRFLPIMDREDILQDILLSLHAARATYDPDRPF